MSRFAVLAKRGREEGNACTICDARITRYQTAYIHLATHRIVCSNCVYDMVELGRTLDAGGHVAEMEP